MKLSKGRMRNKGLKIIVYGPEGIGKSTFASKFPVPIFIDTEGSTCHMDVIRVDPAPASWAEMMEIVQQMASPQYRNGYETLIVDTADWAEKLCIDSLCSEKQWKGIEDAGYGRGYTYLAESFGRFLNALDEIAQHGNNVVVTAHAAMRKFEQPDEMGAYDRWELKLQKKTAPLLKEWADMVLFANYKTTVVNVDGQGAGKGKNKVQGGRRVMYTSHHPCWDAKNRFGLEEELPFDYAAIAHLIPETPAEMINSSCTPPEPQNAGRSASDPAAAGDLIRPSGTFPKGEGPVTSAETAQDADEPVPEELRRLMEMSKVTAPEIRAVVAHVGYFPMDTPIMNYGDDFIHGMLIADWNVVVSMIEEMRDKTPF